MNAATATRRGEVIAEQYARIEPAWEDHGGPVARREVAEAAAVYLNKTSHRNEYRVVERDRKWVLQMRMKRWFCK